MPVPSNRQLVGNLLPPSVLQLAPKKREATRIAQAALAICARRQLGVVSVPHSAQSRANLDTRAHGVFF